MKKQLNMLTIGLCMALAINSHTIAHVSIVPPAPLTDFWQLLESAQSQLHALLLQLPSQLITSLLFGTAHYGEKAVVRITLTDKLSSQEEALLAKRRLLTRAALEKFLGRPLPKNTQLSVGLCFSGGGFRAMITTLGFLKGAQEIGLLDGIDYMAGLSGSTWAIAPWIASGKSIGQYLDELSVRLKSGVQPLMLSNDLEKIIALFITKVLFGQTINAMDIYGALLANTLLKDSGDNRFRVTITDTHKTALTGKLPIPIYTAVQSNIRPYEWYEVTPLELGSTYPKAYIPTWSYGRAFNAGTSTNNAPEQTLGYMLGVFGSAFEADLKDAIDHSADVINLFMDHVPQVVQQLFGSASWYNLTLAALKKILPSLLQRFFDDLRTYLQDNAWAEHRLFPDWQPNFTYRIANNPLSDHERITLIDGGFAFNLPVPPLLRPARKLNVIIMCDASTQSSAALKDAQTYAQAHGLKFPKIDPTTASRKTISIFSDPTDPEVPVVIYFPLIANTDYSTTFDPKKCTTAGYCNTLNFEYDQRDVQELAGLMEFTVKQKAGMLKKALHATLKRQRSGSSSASS